MKNTEIKLIKALKAAIDCDEKPFNDLVNSSEKLGLEDFIASISDDTYPGSTGLWLALKAAIYKGGLVPWNFIQENWAENLSIEHFRVKPEAGCDEGLTGIQLAMMAARDGRSGPWDFIKTNFAEELTEEDFWIKAEKGEDKGKTALWIAMEEIAHCCNAVLWEFALTKFGNKLEDFRAKAEGGTFKGKTALWLVVKAAVCNRPEPWNYVQAKFSDELTIEDFRTQAEQEPDKGKTVLWIAIEGAMTGRSAPWDFIREKFADKLKKEDLLVEHQGVTLISKIMLVSAEKRNRILPAFEGLEDAPPLFTLMYKAHQEDKKRKRSGDEDDDVRPNKERMVNKSALK